MAITILGISAFYHDSAVCLVRDGEIVAAAQEERFSRKKQDSGFPHQAAAYCLREANLNIHEIDYVGFYDKPLLKFERLLGNYLAVAPRGVVSFVKAMSVWLGGKVFTKDLIRRELGGYRGPVMFAEHHESHAASAFYPSPFGDAAVLTMDGVGEWATSSYGVGHGKDLELQAELHYPHSLGMLYSALTSYAGFKVDSGEYKVMGLAPYGEPKYADLIRRELLDLREDGSFKLNMKYFNYLHGFTMTTEAFEELFGAPPRTPESQITQREMDLAASIQVVTEDIMLRMARHVHRTTGMENLCLAGGVALNCVGNGKLLRDGPFKQLWIQPAAGDAGGAIGIALLIYHKVLGRERVQNPVAGNGAFDRMKGAYLGPAFSDADIETALRSVGATYTKHSHSEMIRTTADLLAQEKVVGWLQGRMEFGPRSLGGRSILGDPRSTKMQAVMNLKIKFRESFRPFAPSVLHDHVSDYFDLECDSPYMMLVAPVRNERRIAMTDEQQQLFGIDRLNVPRSDIPAVTHVDYSARIQTVDKATNGAYFEVLQEFYHLTGCPVLVNTSFNVRGEPIVCTPHDAYLCFMRTEMDYLVLGTYVLDKSLQAPLQDDVDWRSQFELD